mgnify:CR=1 FL=1
MIDALCGIIIEGVFFFMNVADFLGVFFFMNVADFLCDNDKMAAIPSKSLHELL